MHNTEAVTGKATFAALKADLDRGLADVAAGRTEVFDRARIVERVRRLLAERSRGV